MDQRRKRNRNKGLQITPESLKHLKTNAEDERNKSMDFFQEFVETLNNARFKQQLLRNHLDSAEEEISNNRHSEEMDMDLDVDLLSPEEEDKEDNPFLEEASVETISHRSHSNINNSRTHQNNNKNISGDCTEQSEQHSAYINNQQQGLFNTQQPPHSIIR